MNAYFNIHCHSTSGTAIAKSDINYRELSANRTTNNQKITHIQNRKLRKNNATHLPLKHILEYRIFSKDLPKQQQLALRECLIPLYAQKHLAYKKLTIANLAFQKASELHDKELYKIIFSGCTFNSASFLNTQLVNVCFIGCYFTKSHFNSADICNCKFIRCYFHQTDFIHTKLNQTTFQDQNYFKLCSFESALLSQCQLINCVLDDTHFLCSHSIHSEAIDCIFHNISFFNDDPNQWQCFNVTRVKDKPKVCMLFDASNPGISTPLALNKLVSSTKLSVIRVACSFPNNSRRPLDNQSNQNINHSTLKLLSVLNKEIHQQPETSIARQFIHTTKSAFSNSKQDNHDVTALKCIFTKAKHIAQCVNAIYLPGGEDVPPDFYAEPEQKTTSWSNNYRRSVLEIALIHESQTRGIPLMAVCRGFQMTSAYFGAKLLQDIQGHKGVQILKFNKNSAIPFVKKSRDVSSLLTTLAVHHQGISLEHWPQHSLEATSVYSNSLHKSQPAKSVKRHSTNKLSQKPLFNEKSQEIIKAAEPAKGASSPAILLQFHPEFYNQPTPKDLNPSLQFSLKHNRLSQENDRYWSLLLQMATTHKCKNRLNQQLHNLFDYPYLMQSRHLE